MPLSPVVWAAAVLVAALYLLFPAVWNGFPLLFYDSGAYLGRYYFDTLSPGRSAAYGYVLGLLRRPDFWPVVIAQVLVTIWLIALMLRVHGFAGRPLLLVGSATVLAIATSLPWLTGQLMPDVFAGLAVLATYLLLFRAGLLSRPERLALIALAAFAAASHNATLAVLVIILVAAIGARPILSGLVPGMGLARVATAIVLGAALLLTANYAVTGQIVWTHGGTAFAFGRLVHDGIVARFLEDNCPDPRFELCQHRAELPDHINTFLWHQGQDGPFARIGGFDDGAAEMRQIAVESLWQYPVTHAVSAGSSAIEQLVAVGTGWGIAPDVWDAYGHIESLTPEAVPAAHAARQRHGELQFDTVNLLHRPVAWLSMLSLALFLLIAPLRRRLPELVPLAGTLTVALLGNAVVCGILSYAHDRYGARIVWTATFFVIVALARILLARAVPALPTAPSRPVSAIAARAEPAVPQLLPLRRRGVRR